MTTETKRAECQVGNIILQQQEHLDLWYAWNGSIVVGPFQWESHLLKCLKEKYV